MINADRVEINCGGNIVNVMIITNGDIIIKTGGSDLKMTACSIVGKSVNIEEGNIDISFTYVDRILVRMRDISPLYRFENVKDNLLMFSYKWK